MPAPHGTMARYQWRAAPCRCADCRRANAAYRRAWYARGGPAVDRYKDHVNAYGRARTAGRRRE
jgi:hypothetical protein